MPGALAVCVRAEATAGPDGSQGLSVNSWGECVECADAPICQRWTGTTGQGAAIDVFRPRAGAHYPATVPSLSRTQLICLIVDNPHYLQWLSMG